MMDFLELFYSDSNILERIEITTTYIVSVLLRNQMQLPNILCATVLFRMLFVIL